MAPAPAPVSAVLLDMDGTLLDLNFDDQVWNHALPRHLAAREGWSLQAASQHVVETIATARGTLSWYCLDHWSEVFGVSVHALEEEEAGFIRVRAGTVAFLQHLSAVGIPAILATNAHPRSMARKLARTGLGGFFRALRSSHEYGAPKEHPAFWDAFHADLGFDAGRAIFVDDSVGVLDAARAWGIAELYGVHTPSSTGLRRTFEHYPAVDSLDELIDRCRVPV